MACLNLVDRSFPHRKASGRRQLGRNTHVHPDMANNPPDVLRLPRYGKFSRDTKFSSRSSSSALRDTLVRFGCPAGPVEWHRLGIQIRASSGKRGKSYHDLDRKSLHRSSSGHLLGSSSREDMVQSQTGWWTSWGIHSRPYNFLQD